MRHITVKNWLGLTLSCSLLVACGGGGGSSNSATPESSGDVSISGIAAASSGDAALVATRQDKLFKLIDQFNMVQRAFAAAQTGALNNESLAGATVTLYKIFASGTEEQVDIGSVTTDSNGAFSIPDIEPAPAGSGASTDFYYEIRITKGELTLRSPLAPSDDAVVNVTPETDLAAKILSDVVDIPGQDNPPLPNAQTTEAMREMVIQNAADLVDDDAIAIPSAVGTANQSILLAAANGIAAAGGNAEKMFKATAFEREFMALDADSSPSNSDAAAYIKRIIRESCNQEEGDYMPQALADALGEFFNASDNTVTPTEIITAYNNHSSATDIDLTQAVTNFKTILAGIEENYDTTADQVSDLDNADFSASMELKIDQAMAFILSLGQGTNAICQIAPTLDLLGFLSELLGKPSLANPSIADAQIYHNSGFGCNEGSGEGHFVAEVKVYKANKTISSVVVTSSDTSALGGDGTETLTLEGGTYRSDADGICVNLATSVTYTITATFDDASTATKTLIRNHPRIPEASSQVLVSGSFVNGSDNSASPTVVTTSRPLYQWTSPADELTAIINDSANGAISSALASASAVVKYTYEFSHVNTSVSPVGPAGACDMVSSGTLYSVDSFMPTVDCDVSACATALGTSASNIACRMNIQSFYVDANDDILGQAAGHFRFFCVDTDSDGNCG